MVVSNVCFMFIQFDCNCSKGLVQPPTSLLVVSMCNLGVHFGENMISNDKRCQKKSDF